MNFKIVKRGPINRIVDLNGHIVKAKDGTALDKGGHKDKGVLIRKVIKKK